MNINVLVANLERTICGKQLLLQTIDHPDVKQFVSINIDELQRILNDAKSVQKQVNQLEKSYDDLICSENC